SADVGRSKADFRREVSAIRMIATDREHGKSQLALRHQLLIVDCVLRESGKLPAERIVNGAGASVQRGIVVAGLLVNAGGGCGQLIIKAIKQDALASGDQTLHVGAAKIEMPDFWIFKLIIPVADPGKRRIHYDPSGYPRRV